MAKMKLTRKQQAKVNEVTQLFDTSFRRDINTLNFSGVDKKHSRRMYEICEALYYDLKTPFFTEARFPSGYRPDIICPLYLNGTIIEVRNSETEKESQAKKVPPELQGFTTIYSDCDKEFKLRDIQ